MTLSRVQRPVVQDTRTVFRAGAADIPDLQCPCPHGVLPRQAIKRLLRDVGTVEIMRYGHPKDGRGSRRRVTEGNNGIVLSRETVP